MLRSVKYGVVGVILAGVVGGTVAWTNTDKTVHLVVDGQSRTIRTTADDVGQVVKNAGYRAGPHDLLAPSASSHVRDGGTIVLKRGRLLRLDVDGAAQSVWTTAPTVAQALSDLGFTNSDFTSVSRSRRLSLGATDISVRTPKFVTVVHDGVRTSVTTTDSTVRALFADMSLTLGRFDRMSTSMSAALNPGMTITLSRVVHGTLKKTRSVPFATHTTDDSSLASGTTQIVRTGRPGLLQTTWATVFVDGKLVGRTKIGNVVLREPVARLRKIGTKQPEAATSTGSSGSNASGPTPSPGSAQAIAKSMLSSYGWSQSQFSCLESMWTRESGWRVNAANASGAYGIPQALPGSKMASAGSDWRTNARTQIKWGLGYIASRYNSPCQAWAIWQTQSWY